MVGRTIGQYEILEQLGSGGMGIVYKAHDSRLHRTVALKFLPPHLSEDASAKERFMQEARAASALDHANICTIFEIAEADDGQLFIAMAFYDGETLKYQLQNGSIPPGEAALIAHQVAIGLSRAHEAGIVHRDIKPANIMVTSRGEVKILDFGVAKLSQSADLTQAGSTLGTAAYMSPEQARGEKVDARSDIWSVGILLYEMLAGHTPFGGGYEAAMVYAIINEDPQPIGTDGADELETIITRCLAKTPVDRFQTTEELADALEPLLTPSGARRIAAAPSGTVASSTRPQSPARVMGLFVAAATVVLALVYTGMIAFGLPDWVFPLGVLLMAAGAPILYMAARNEQRDTGPGWLTLRRATVGGILSMSGLALLTGGFMVMRAMGLGPAATLVTSGALQENAKLLVADFDNESNDSTLAGSVTELIRIDLSQSNAINLMDGSDIVSVLSRMNRPQNTAIDLDTAMEIAAREGAEAVVAGDIRSIGKGFVISARLLAAHDGSELVAFRETATDDGAIIGAIDNLSAKLREQIGESIKSIRENTDLERVTTSSLDALRLYSQGVAAEDRGDPARAMDLLQQAISIDSTFGMAYRKLAVVYGNAGVAEDLVIDAATHAYRYRDRIPERERGLAEAYYFAVVDRDRDRQVAAYEQVLSKYPDEVAALNNVTIVYNTRGEYEKAEKVLRHLLKIGDRFVFYSNMIQTLSALGKLEETQSWIDRFIERHPEHPGQVWMQFEQAISTGQHDGADSLIHSTSFNNSPFWQASDQFYLRIHALLEGRLADATRFSLRESEIESGRNNPAAALGINIRLASAVLTINKNEALARGILEAALRKYPLDSAEPASRPYLGLIIFRARLGDVEQARALKAEYERLVPGGRRQGAYRQRLVDAEILASEGKPGEAIQELIRSQTEDRCAKCFLYREAQLFERLDSIDAAIERYRRVADDTEFYLVDFTADARAPALFRLGELYSERGDIDEAIEAYSRFVDLWKDADAELQPQVTYARERIDQLLKQKTREPSIP